MYLFVHLSAHSTTEQCTFLVGLCKSNLCKKHTYPRLLKKVMENLQSLLTTELKIGDDIIQIILGTAMGDNLCMNPLAGLSGSFNNYVQFPCRQCNVSQAAYSQCEDSDQFFELSKDLRSDYMPGQNCGIRTETPLRHLPGFHVWEDLPGKDTFFVPLLHISCKAPTMMTKENYFIV